MLSSQRVVKHQASCFHGKDLRSARVDGISCTIFSPPIRLILLPWGRLHVPREFLESTAPFSQYIPAHQVSSASMGEIP